MKDIVVTAAALAAVAATAIVSMAIPVTCMWVIIHFICKWW